MTKESEFTKTRGLKRVYLAFGNSFRALKWLVKNEAAIRQELLLLIICIPISFY